MFGHDDDQPQDDNSANPAAQDGAAPAPQHEIKPIMPTASTPAEQNWQHPGSPLGSSPLGDESDEAAAQVKPPTPPEPPKADPAPAAGPPALTPDATQPSTSDLADLKQQALDKLSPLVGQLEQSPEEKFRTIMMLIQATDDQTKLKEAYEIAQSIPDEKVRAQALLDVVNEINYFTQQKN